MLRPLMRERLPSLGIAAVCGVLAIFLLLNGRGASDVREANRLGAAGDYDAAISTARGVDRAPADLQALLATARAQTAAHRPAAADAAWAVVARRDPNNWQVHVEWARAAATLNGDRAAARRHYERARELNPSLPRLP